MADASEIVGGKPRKRGTGKPAQRLAVAGPSKLKSTIHLSVEASQRLDVHCSMARMDRSAMVERLINEHLRRYVVQDRGRGPQGVVAGDDALRESA
jgi:hypothetical protein